MVLWAFGMATTLLLVGLWGRAETHDQVTVQETARSAVNAEIASDRIYSWIEDGVASRSDTTRSLKPTFSSTQWMTMPRQGDPASVEVSTPFVQQASGPAGS
jgi:hypothetical protein